MCKIFDKERAQKEKKLTLLLVNGLIVFSLHN